MLNEVKIIGNVGKDPEMRRTQDGRPVANFSIATSKKWKGKDGEPKEQTFWHNIVCWNENLCKIIEAYVKKGARIYVCGELQTRKWQDQQGQDRYSTEVVLNGYDAKILLLDRKENGDGSQPREKADAGPRETSKPAAQADKPFTFEDEIPF